MKKCKKCKKLKLGNNFSKRKNVKDGLSSWCKLCCNRYNKQWKIKNKEYCIQYNKQWRFENREHRREYAKKYRKEHGAFERERIRNNPKLRCNHALSRTISLSLRGNKKRKKWQKLVGYTLDDLIAHLEKQFDKNMTWDNYGTYWHIDHIIPKSWFVFKTAEDVGFIMCWELNNLQPLEAFKNLSKHNRYII